MSEPTAAATAQPGTQVPGTTPASVEPTVVPGIRIGALELARELGMDSPTAEQRAVIEAPLAPALVIAGAGSGKTATMANRVIWLLANGLVAPHEVLGLTFTRKAAGELSKRISGHITTLREAGLLPESAGATADLGEHQVSAADLFDRPTVSTYNAFANTIFRDNALLVGREPESVLLGENAAWGLARRTIVEFGDDRLVPLRKNLDQLVDSVLDLSHELSENIADPEAVASFAERFHQLAELPYTEGKAKNSPYASVTAAVANIDSLPLLVELAERYASAKKQRGLVEFSDQVALALAICRRHPPVVASFRERFRVVLLDEYQDTSVVQTHLLAELFSSHGVMAVGDPHQSIYGWRGASANNLASFGRDFNGTEPTARFSLSTSWRNSQRVLDAANVLVAPLTADSAVAVDTLLARPGAPLGTVDVRYAETRAEEAEAAAEWMAAQLSQPLPDGAKPRSAAMLFRVRNHMEFFAEALSRRGIPNHILGVGGLLHEPEIVDVVSALRATHDPTAGSALIRLLSGARFRVGTKDLRGLSAIASWLAKTDSFNAPLDQGIVDSMRESVAPDDRASLVDALDFVAENPTHPLIVAQVSDEGIATLVRAGLLLASFRARVGLPLGDLVRFVEQELLLDIELAANESTVKTRAGRPFSSLNAFHDEITAFQRSDDEGTLGSFLSWLRRAEKRDDLSPRTEEPEPGTVQLLTLHGSKGLEWDVVAIPRLTSDEIPARSKEGNGWLRFGTLPYEFRGDADVLPVLDWQTATSQQVFDASEKSFKAELAAKYMAEERRLIYVGVTRARDALLLSGSFWSTQKTPRKPSIFLSELAAAELIPELPAEPINDENPAESDGVSAEWPLDPLGHRRSTVTMAADLVEAERAAQRPREEAGTTLAGVAGPIDYTVVDLGADVGRWETELRLLLAERDRAVQDALEVPLPERIAASRFKDFVTDPRAVARALRRPMPEKPFRQTRLGTRFHSWVENRYGTAGSGELIDTEWFEGDRDPEDIPVDQAALAVLQATFEASEWATRKPIEVEVEIHLVLGHHIVVCKIDAIFRDGDRYTVVDWKTGRAPKDAADLEVKQLQLALYRLAYARWAGIDPELIDAVFYFVADDTTIAPERLYSEADLMALWPF